MRKPDDRHSQDQSYLTIVPYRPAHCRLHACTQGTGVLLPDRDTLPTIEPGQQRPQLFNLSPKRCRLARQTRDLDNRSFRSSRRAAHIGPTCAVRQGMNNQGGLGPIAKRTGERIPPILTQELVPGTASHSASTRRLAATFCSMLSRSAGSLTALARRRSSAWAASNTRRAVARSPVACSTS